MALLVVSTASAWAGLGGAPANLGKDAVASRANKASTGLSTYTDVERTLESGTTVHEYMDAGGTVFAVSWSGPYLPDLKDILGTHFDTLVAQAGKRKGAGRSRLEIKQTDVVIVSGGHMGAFEGKAWLPDKLPAGFNPDDIK